MNSKKNNTKKIKLFDFNKISTLVPFEKRLDGFFLNTVTGFKIGSTGPYRSNFYGIGLVHSGKIKLFTDLNENIIEGYNLIAMGPEIIRQWNPQKESFIIETIFFTEDFIIKEKSDLFFLKKLDFFNCNGNHVFPLSISQFEKLRLIFNQINMLTSESHSERNNMIKYLIILLILEIKLLDASSENQHQIDTNSSLIHNFKDLVIKNFREERSVAFYASKLFMNSKYLSVIIKEKTGKTAKEWINEMVILEAKVLLNDVSLNISEIAHELNFVDSNVFGKYFKKYTGKTPNNYRLALQGKTR